MQVVVENQQKERYLYGKNTIILDQQKQLQQDVALIGRIDVVPTILEVICRTTKMGFAAVARVTDDRWIACRVRDEINFGLLPGGELEIKTTLCDEIRNSGQMIVFDNAAEDPQYCNHHTPRMYGLQSYISIPIFLKTGQFFGTLCAIDPRPARINNSETVSMFQLFADLIAFHFAIEQEKESTKDQLSLATRQLNGYKEDVSQYARLTSHSLQEPLRKMRLFADLIVEANERDEKEKLTVTAHKIRQFAHDMTQMVRDINEYSALEMPNSAMEATDLNEVVQNVTHRMKPALEEKGAIIECDVLHTIKAVPGQMVRLFYNLISNAVKYTRNNVPPVIRIYSRDCAPDEVQGNPLLNQRRRYCEVSIEDNGPGLHTSEIEHLFEITRKTDQQGLPEGFGSGLAQARKIAHRHEGMITVRSTLGQGSVFSVFLPIE